jgi:hypothetical protein
VPQKDGDEENLTRPRAVTTSTYPSTVTPPKLEDKDLGLSLGGNFADMFSGFGKRKSAILEVEEKRTVPQTIVCKTKLMLSSRLISLRSILQPRPRSRLGHMQVTA